MLELLMQRGDDGVLVACDVTGQEAIGSFGWDEVLTCRITRPRNVKHHRLFFGLLGLVFKSQNYYATSEHMLDDIKIAVGHYEVVPSKFGGTRRRPKSINFNSMDQTAFNEFYEKAMHFILTEILPRMDRADLEQRVYEILGGPTPQQLERQSNG
jgi:hypothetical protein